MFIENNLEDIVVLLSEAFFACFYCTYLNIRLQHGVGK